MATRHKAFSIVRSDERVAHDAACRDRRAGGRIGRRVASDGGLAAIPDGPGRGWRACLGQSGVQDVSAYAPSDPRPAGGRPWRSAVTSRAGGTGDRGAGRAVRGTTAPQAATSPTGAMERRNRRAEPGPSRGAVRHSKARPSPSRRTRYPENRPRRGAHRHRGGAERQRNRWRREAPLDAHHAPAPWDSQEGYGFLVDIKYLSYACRIGRAAKLHEPPDLVSLFVAAQKGRRFHIRSAFNLAPIVCRIEGCLCGNEGCPCRIERPVGGNEGRTSHVTCHVTISHRGLPM